MIFRPLDAGRLRLSNRLMAPPHASAINDLFGTPEQAESHLGYWKPRVEAGLGWVDGITGYIGNLKTETLAQAFAPALLDDVLGHIEAEVAAFA